MNVSVIGLGYVGVVSTASVAAAGTCMERMLIASGRPVSEDRRDSSR
jgi:UDP-glucose 6-dehydrogenase